MIKLHHVWQHRQIKAWAARTARLGLLFWLVSACRNEPEFSLPTTADVTVPHRVEQQTHFWAVHGVTFSAQFESDWVPFDTPATLILTIRNAGSRELRLPWSRQHGSWPFRETETGRVYLDLKHKTVSVEWGSFDRVERVVREPWSEGASIVPPFSQLSWRTKIRLPNASTQDYGAVAASAFLLPLAVQFDGEPERFSPIRFPSCTVQFAQESAFQLGQEWTAALLQQCLQSQPNLVVPIAIGMAEKDVIGVTDDLIAMLPGPSFAARDSLLTALRLVTKEDLGRHVELWRSWWESARGATWAMRNRQLEPRVD